MAAEEYILPVVLHILRDDSSDKGLDTLLVLSSSPTYYGMQADKTCYVSEVVEFCSFTQHPACNSCDKKKCCAQRNGLRLFVSLKTSVVPAAHIGNIFPHSPLIYEYI